MNSGDIKMFPTMHLGSVNVLERRTPHLLSENDRPLVHPALRPSQNAAGAGTRHPPRSRNELRSPTAINPVAAAAMASGSSHVPVRPMFQGLPLSSLTSTGLNLNMNMLTAANSLAAASTSSSTTTLPSPLLQYPGLFPGPEELKYLSMAQIQAANQAHLAGEVAKLKPPFLTRNYLELAMLVCNTFRGKLFPCPHCRYVTDRRNNLKRHVATMHQACDKQLECCGVTFSTKASLREHITIFHHNGYSCPFCGRRFCRKALLKRHLSVHSGQKDYTCPHCDYATSHKSNLERHKRIHARLQIMGSSGLEDGERQDGVMFEENEAMEGSSNIELHQRVFGSSFSHVSEDRDRNQESWNPSDRDQMSRISTSNHSDDPEDCEISIDDDDDDDDDDDSIIDACTIDNHAINLATTPSNHCVRDGSNHPINLITESNARANAAATMAARLTNGFSPMPLAHESKVPYNYTSKTQPSNK